MENRPITSYESDLIGSLNQIKAKISDTTLELTGSIKDLEAKILDNTPKVKILTEELDNLLQLQEKQLDSGILFIKATKTQKEIVNRLDSLDSLVSSSESTFKSYMAEYGEMLHEYKGIDSKLQGVAAEIQYLNGYLPSDRSNDFSDFTYLFSGAWSVIVEYGEMAVEIIERLEETVIDVGEWAELVRTKREKSNSTHATFKRIGLHHMIIHLTWLMVLISSILTLSTNNISDSWTWFVTCYNFLYPVVILFLTALEVKNSSLPLSSIVRISQGIISSIFGYAALYHSVDITTSGEFNQSLGAVKATYFSITTFTTTGYGDIYPEKVLSRLLAGSEMILGFISSTFIMSILVSLFLKWKPSDD